MKPNSHPSKKSRRWRWVAALIGLLALAGVAVYYLLGGSDRRKRMDKISQIAKLALPGVPDLTPDQAADLVRQGRAVLVDRREAAEQRVSVIAGSVPAAEFEQNPEAYRGRTVIAYCTLGVRSGRYVQELQRRGVEAINLRGGILGWAHAGQAVVDPSGNETRRIFVSGPAVHLLPDGYEGVR